MGHWKSEYDRWVDMLAGLNSGPGKANVAWNSALLYDMIATQPVVYEFPQIAVPTTLFIGTGDTTAPGSDGAPEAVRKTFGNYKQPGRDAVKAIPHVTLIEFDGLGHAPQMEGPEKFHRLLLEALAK